MGWACWTLFKPAVRSFSCCSCVQATKRSTIQVDPIVPSNMSLQSVSGFMSSYSPLSDRHSAADEEKDLHMRLRSDGEGGHKQARQDAKPAKLIDGRTVSDAIIGLSDGMTVPFALTAGLSALGDTKVVVFGGMAELIAGAISMGLGGYLGAKSEE